MSIRIGIGTNLIPTSWDFDLQKYITGLTTELSDAQKTRINTFLTSLKTGLGITLLSEVFDFMYILANETEEAALRNLVNRIYDATAESSPLFTQYEGFKGDGSSAYLDTGFVPVDDSINFIQDSASFGCYVRECISEVGFSMGTMEVTTNIQTRLTPIYNANRAYYPINGAIAYYNNTDALGMFIVNRVISTKIGLYINGNLLNDHNNTSIGLNNYPFYILAVCNTGVLSAPSTQQISFAFAGRGLTQSEITLLTNCVETYMDDLGKGVIS